jgi:FkbM family methyltransferase
VPLRRVDDRVSDKPGKLYLPQHDDTVSGLSSNPDEGIEVPVVPLDNLVGERVDLLKVDVEGMEMQVLKGAMNILRRDRPYLFIEVQDANREAFLR